MERAYYRGLLFMFSALAPLAVACGDGESNGGSGSDANAGGSGGACEPMTCEDQGIDCGEIDDGCGETLRCGGACPGAGGSSGSGGTSGQGGAKDCSGDVTSSEPRTARRATSAGFSGTDADYLELYELACSDVSDCADACLDRGGQEDMCNASECLETGTGSSDCLPAPVWSNLPAIQFEDASVYDMTQIILVFTPYQDLLLTDQYELEVPEDAEIKGIKVEVLRAGDESVADESVRIIKGGSVGMAERALPQTWTADPTWVTYGGPDDLWGEEWMPADVNSDDFGVAFSAAYTKTVGNTRAYVDQVRVTVSYVPCL